MDEPVVRFVLPGLLHGKQRARHRVVRTKAGAQFVSTYTPAQTRREEGEVALFASAAMQGRAPLEGPIDLRVCVFLPVPASWSGIKQRKALTGAIMPAGKPDIDNLTKSVLDGINGRVFRDDAQVVSLAAWKRYSDTPRVVVEVRAAVPALTETALVSARARLIADTDAAAVMA